MTRRSYEFGGRTQGLRFAILARVSTQKQLQHGESVAVQVNSLHEAVARLGGLIVNPDRYVGTEHATPGHDRKLLRKLLDDAATQQFDAVTVVDFDRWSRGNQLSEEGLDTLKACGVRFFVGTEEKDIEDEDTRMLLGVQSHFNKNAVAKLIRKGQMSRIARALRGWPTAGKSSGEGKRRSPWPYGRKLLNPEQRELGGASANWGLDEEEAAQLRAVAAYYLQPDITWKLVAERYGDNGTTWQRRIKTAGATWQMEFKRLSVKPAIFQVHGSLPANMRHEGDTLIISVPVPPILDESTVRAIAEKSRSQRTINTNPPARTFALRGYLKCARCGSNLQIHHDRKNNRVYVQHHGLTRTEKCPKQTIGRYEGLQKSVLQALAGLIADTNQLKASIRDSLRARQSQRPEALRRRDEVELLRRKASLRVERLTDELLGDDVTEALRASIKLRAQKLQGELEQLDAELKSLDAELHVVPIPDNLDSEVEFAVRALTGGRKSMLHWSPEQKRQLARFFFGVPHRKPQAHASGIATEDPLDQDGVYVDRVRGTNGAPDSLRWVAKGWFGVFDAAMAAAPTRRGSGGGRGGLDPSRLNDFLKNVDLTRFRLPREAANAVERRSIRAKWSSKRWPTTRRRSFSRTTTRRVWPSPAGPTSC